MYEPLHHKYRPQTFGELVGQDAIATTLTNAIITQRIAPAYLFTGPRGTGKTSSARILAKSLNCLSSPQPTPTPCGNCEVCRAISRGSALDTIEIDAASNTGVDNIREIIERAQFAPVQGRYKVYVIDECHMLSNAAFNSLLKTLEEPPARVVFVLATTDPQRVLPTIISRCQRFDYRRIPLESMVDHLNKIASKENIDITAEAITIVSQIANGGLRDAESLLDQLSLLSGTITPVMVWDLVGSVPEQDLLQLLKAIAVDNSSEVIDLCRNIMNRGREPLIILQNLANFYLNLLIAKTAPSRQDLVAVTSSTWKDLCDLAQTIDTNLIIRGQQHLKDSEFQLKNTTSPRLWLEITLLGLLPSALQKVEYVPITTPTPQPSKTPAKITYENSNFTAQEAVTISPNKPQESVNFEQKKSPQPPVEPEITQPVAEFSLTQIWEQMLAKLQYPNNKAFFKQHGHLISVNDSSVSIGVKNNTLLNIAKGKIADVEAAFAVVLKHHVKVILQLSNPEDSKKNITENIPAQNLVKQEYSPEIPAENLEKKEDFAANIPAENLGKKEDSVTQPIAPKHEIVKQEIEKDYTDDEVKKAAEAIAKFFNGEIVTLSQINQNTKIDIGPKTEKINKPLISGRPKIEEILKNRDGDDIPF